MRLFVVSVWLLISIACSPKSEKPEIIQIAVAEKPGVSATVSEIEHGKWAVDFEFIDLHKVMIFSRSNGNYRAGSWEPKTEGVRLERLNGFDAIVFEQPSRSARFVFQPQTEDIPKDYTPFIPFTDGGMAIFSDQFELLPVVSAVAALNLDGDISKWNGEQPELEVKIVSDRSLIKNGEIFKGQAVVRGIGKGTYVYVGNAQITQGQDFAGIIDPGLPGWIAKRFDQDLTNIFNGHRILWQDGLNTKTTVLFAFRGYDGDGFHNNGGAVGNLLSLETFGSGLKEESPGKLAHFHWFFAHEAAHLFQNRTGQHLENPNEAWISEGAANAMAYQVLQTQNLASQSFIVEKYQSEFAECAAYLEKHILREAASLSQYYAYYSCGNIMALITAASLPNNTLFGFWNAMLEQNLETNGFSQKIYFKTMRELGSSQDIIERLRFLSTQKIENPKKYLIDLVRDTGLQVEFDQAGVLTSIVLP